MATIIPLGPAVVDIKGVRAGDRNVITITVTSDGTPVNLTGLTPSAQARKKSTDADPALTAVVLVTDALAGKMELRWPGDAVLALLGTAATWTGVWDLQIDDAAQDALTLAAGSFEAVMDVTRP
jgi:hypothetical protein